MKAVSLITGGGSTMAAAADAIISGELKDLELIAVVSSDPQVGGLEKAHKRNIPTYIVDRKALSKEVFREQLFKVLDNLNPDLVSQNGWLPMTPDPVIKRFLHHIINQHPGATDPDHSGNGFGGKGMHGSAVTCAALAYAWLTDDPNPTTESTVHHVLPQGYDHGPIISRVSMPIPPLDWSEFVGDNKRIMNTSSAMNMLLGTTEQVKADLLPIEHRNVIQVLGDFAKCVARITHRPQLIPDEQIHILYQAKELAVELFPNG